MNNRTKKLAIIFGAMVGGVALWQVLYPTFLEPLATLDQRLEARGEVLTELENLEKATKKAADEYRALVSRIGSFDIDRLTTQVRDRINVLIDKHKLVADSVSPSRPIEDRKTKLWTVIINVKAVGRLESVVGFLKDVSELPQLSRIGNVALYPTSTSPGSTEAAKVNVRVPIEIKALPQQKLVGVIQEKELHPPDAMVRNQARDYSALWNARPFFDYVPPVPLAAEAGKDAVTHENQEAALRGSATGGEPPYTFQWSGEAISDPAGQSIVVQTKGFSVGEHLYTMSVTDAVGNTATDTVKVTIKASAAPPPQTVRAADKPPPPKDPRWKDRSTLELVMMVGRSDTEGDIDELMTQSKTDGGLRYFKIGDEFDGGRLMYVHQTGGVVLRKDLAHINEDRPYIYTIGSPLDQDLPIDGAVDYPELQAAAQKLSETRPAAEDKPASPGPDAGGSGSREALPAGADGQAAPAPEPGSGDTPASAQPAGAARRGAAPRQNSSPPNLPPGRRSRTPRAP